MLELLELLVLPVLGLPVQPARQDPSEHLVPSPQLDQQEQQVLVSRGFKVHQELMVKTE